MPLSDYWEVRFRQSYPGASDILNVFHCKSNSATISATDVCNAAIAGIMAPLKALQSNSLHHEEVIAQNLSDRFKIAFVNTDSHVGQMGGEFLPVFMAYSFIVERLTNDIRHGYKRFCGVAEDALANG